MNYRSIFLINEIILTRNVLLHTILRQKIASFLELLFTPPTMATFFYCVIAYQSTLRFSYCCMGLSYQVPWPGYWVEISFEKVYISTVSFLHPESVKGFLEKLFQTVASIQSCCRVKGFTNSICYQDAEGLSRESKRRKDF